MDLLDVARLTQGRLKLQRERLDLARLARQSAEDHRHALELAGLSLHVQVPSTPVWMIGDATRVAQALGNVLANAGKFTPPGGRVAVGLKTDGSSQQAVLMVRDTGIGIEPEILPHIFEALTQADGSLDRSRGGLGLGLSVASGLVALHGGSIEAASEGAGRGATFAMRLPLAPELPALAGTEVAAGPVGQHRRVLVVEDNRDSAETLQMVLEVGGYEVTVAYSGPEGVAAARAVRPNIVLCDIGLPGMNGFGVAEALRGDPETAAACLIAVTGYGDEEYRQRALEAGFDAHMVKPVDPEDLLRRLALAHSSG
ncbi:MAG: response regulator [Armatimonadetes bacterium]|nr:response regulator [Armatimonadota bacterium]